jgi:uridine kinase
VAEDPAPRICRYADLAELVRRAPPRCGAVRLVAIDGHGGAGKSVFAARLARSLGSVPVVHTDDFASWNRSVKWWSRLEKEVLRPLQLGLPVRFRTYDWSARRLGRWQTVPASAVVVLEGVSSARAEVAERLSLTVWIEAPLHERLARGLARDGEGMRAQWDQWIAEEETHFAIDRTRERAALVVDGSPSTAHDPEAEFICVD